MNYNQLAYGHLWTLRDLPKDWLGAEILRMADLDHDDALSDQEIPRAEWVRFERAVKDFQSKNGFIGADLDGSLGPRTLESLRNAFQLLPQLSTLKTVGPVEFTRAETPTSPPTNPVQAYGLPAAIWNLYGGAIGEQANAHGIPINVALAIFTVEAGGRAYDPTTGLIMIQFEDHVFSNRSRTYYKPPKYGTQGQEWADLEAAARINLNAAFEATSAGLPQIMGFNAGLAGYNSAIEMFLAFQRSAAEQVRGFFNFLKNDGLVPLILAQNWTAFVTRYNGPGNVSKYQAALESVLRTCPTIQ